MPTVNFYLKKKEEATGESLIYLQFKYNGQRLVYSFGQTIDLSNWNKKKQRLKSNTQTTADGQLYLNDLLDKLEEICLNCYYTELANGVPEPAVLKKHLEAFVKKTDEKSRPTFYQLIDRFINNEIQTGGADKSKATLTIYATAKKHLEGFEKSYRYPLSYETITLDFFYRFVAYLKGKGLGPNTIHKQIKTLKTFLNEAVSLHYTTNTAFRNKKFSVKTAESDSVYLREDELIKLFNHKFDSKRLEQVKDLFIFGAFTGLRFSDYNNVRPENIISEDGDTYIKIKTLKTDEVVFIPCHPIVLRVFEKYSDQPNRLPKRISNQKFNEFIKEAAEKAGLKEKGRLIGDPKKPLYDCISSHTARRSFATHWYLDGYEPKELMKITGHRTEKAFMQYIKVSKFNTAKKLGKRMKDAWTQKSLRIAG